MRKCPRCDSYMSNHIEYSYGNSNLIHTCSYCGYSSKDSSFYTSNKTSPLYDLYEKVTNYINNRKR